MKSKGFTLIEVLAIIAILAIIATITVPIINNQLDDSKKNISKASALNYIKIIEEFQLYNKVNKKNINLNGTYNIKKNGNLYNKDETIEIETKGASPENGILTFENNDLVSGCITIDKFAVSFENGKPSNVKKGKCIYDEIATRPEIVTSGDGLYESTIELGRYIYRGAKPNNYISLKENGNDATYRIISYENDGTIKVIRDASIGLKAFDENDSNDTTTGPRHNTNNTFCNYSGTYYGCNVWGNLSNTFYNGSTIGNTFNYKYYTNNTNTELTNSSNAGTVTVDSTLNQYLNNTWITDKEMAKYIDNHDFNVGGIYYPSSYTGGDKGLQKEESEEKSYTWNGKIGLMNITDYVEASTNPECTSVYSNFYYNTNYYYENSQHITGYDNWPCSNRTYNWLPKKITEWSLSPYSSGQTRTWHVHSAGYFSYLNTNNDIDVRPAFYLKSTVSLTGEGTKTNPYKIIEY